MGVLRARTPLFKILNTPLPTCHHLPSPPPPPLELVVEIKDNVAKGMKGSAMDTVFTMQQRCKPAFLEADALP